MSRGALLTGLGAFAGTALVTLFQAPALAHGVGGRGDLPLPVWQVVWGAAIALVVSFAGLGLLWVTPRLAAASVGRDLGRAATRFIDILEWPARVVALLLWLVVVTAGLFGIDNPAVNIAPVTVYVAFWVGLQIVSALFGGFWARISPFDTVVMLLRQEGPSASDTPPVGTVGLVGVISIAAFLWLELAYHTPADPRVLGVAMVAYAVVMIGGGLHGGRGWLRANDGFSVLASLLGAIAPLYRRADSSFAMRFPISGLSRIRPTNWTVPFVVVVLGSTTFDGMEGVDFWAEAIAGRTGWELTLMNTMGLVWVIAAVAAAFYAASWLTGRVTGQHYSEVADDFVASLVPIMLAYAIAHYFSLLVFEGQNFLIQASDPYGEGWDIFGTQGDSVDFLLVSTTTIAWVQVVSIVVGHIAGVLVAHDRAIERYEPQVAIRSQYPMLGVMISYTVVGLLLLLNA